MIRCESYLVGSAAVSWGMKRGNRKQTQLSLPTNTATGCCTCNMLDLGSGSTVRSSVLILARNNGAEPEKVCEGNQKVISGECWGLESPIVMANTYFFTAPMYGYDWKVFKRQSKTLGFCISEPRAKHILISLLKLFELQTWIELEIQCRQRLNDPK